MFETLVITFREGLEAFLIVAIMAAYLVKTDRKSLLKPLVAGIFAALIISVTTGWHVADLAQNPLWEGSLAMISGILVASFTAYMMTHAKNIRGDIHERMERHASKTGLTAALGVFLFTTLMISREGMETALMLGAMSAKAHPAQMWLGAFLGLTSVAVIGYMWVRRSDKINLKLFMQVTGAFLVLFSIHLFLYGIHELGEMSAIPFVGQAANDWLHIHTEILGHDSVYAQMITYGLLVVPTGWLLLSYLSEKMTFSRRAYE